MKRYVAGWVKRRGEIGVLALCSTVGLAGCQSMPTADWLTQAPVRAASRTEPAKLPNFPLAADRLRSEPLAGTSAVAPSELAGEGDVDHSIVLARATEESRVIRGLRISPRNGGADSADDVIVLDRPGEPEESELETIQADTYEPSFIESGVDGVEIVDGDVCYMGVCCAETAGVSDDQPGKWDNVAFRMGASYYSNDNTSTAGMPMLVDGSMQIHSRYFVHGGAGTEYLDGEWPFVYSIGASKLAVIEGDQVIRPLILSFSYDAYWDNEFFTTNDTAYLDQIRILIGKALLPDLDVGVWGSIALRDTDALLIRPPLAPLQINTTLSSRVAAYAAANLTSKGDLVILSTGWEDGPGKFFLELDGYLPICRWLSLWTGFGYGSAGTFDAVLGFEWSIGRGHLLRQLCGDCDGCLGCGGVACEPCGPRYRGGWATRNYRGALRLPTPSRMRRGLSDPTWQPATIPTDRSIGPCSCIDGGPILP